MTEKFLRVDTNKLLDGIINTSYLSGRNVILFYRTKTVKRLKYPSAFGLHKLHQKYGSSKGFNSDYKEQRMPNSSKPVKLSETPFNIHDLWRDNKKMQDNSIQCKLDFRHKPLVV